MCAAVTVPSLMMATLIDSEESLARKTDRRTTGGQADRERETDRQSDRQTHRHTHTHIGSSCTVFFPK